MNAFSSLLASLPAAHGGYLGQTIALAVAVSWTVCALLSETVSRRLGAHVVNVLRMVLSLLFIGALLWVCTGSPIPPRADATTWGWLLASGAWAMCLATTACSTPICSSVRASANSS